MPSRAPLLLLVPALLAACATSPEPAGGKDGIPNAGAGPFRAIVKGEISGIHSAPLCLDDLNLHGRDGMVLDADDDPATLEVYGYYSSVAVPPDSGSSFDPPIAIVRYHALDGRSFEYTADSVLAPQEPWEGSAVTSPHVFRHAGRTWLYYAGAGGIGLARGDDGVHFERVGNAPVLGPAKGGWENGLAPKSPGVLILDDGTFRMFYEVSDAEGVSRIGEARSDDGVAWTRVGTAPALDLGTDTDAGPAYDGASVGGPFPMLATSGEGRRELRLYYAAVDRDDNGTIGLAARYGDDGQLQRGESPVYGNGSYRHPFAPSVVVFEHFSFLHATDLYSSTFLAEAGVSIPVVEVGVAPAEVTLPPPDPK